MTFQHENAIKTGSNSPRSNSGKEQNENSNLIVNYLPDNVDKSFLQGLFCRFGEIQSVRIVHDHGTGVPKGYGFVKFKQRDDAIRAIKDLDGLPVFNKRIKVAFSQPGGSQHKSNLFIGNLPREFEEKDIFNLFSNFGQIIDHRILRHRNGDSKQCGFVRLNDDVIAQTAIRELNGVWMGKCRLLVKLAKRSSRKKREAGVVHLDAVDEQERRSHSGSASNYSQSATAQQNYFPSQLGSDISTSEITRSKSRQSINSIGSLSRPHSYTSLSTLENSWRSMSFSDPSSCDLPNYSFYRREFPLEHESPYYNHFYESQRPHSSGHMSREQLDQIRLRERVRKRYDDFRDELENSDRYSNKSRLPPQTPVINPPFEHKFPGSESYKYHERSKHRFHEAEFASQSPKNYKQCLSYSSTMFPTDKEMYSKTMGSPPSKSTASKSEQLKMFQLVPCDLLNSPITGPKIK